MGKIDNGILGGVRGKVANIVGYSLNGQKVIRVIGEKVKPLTVKQLNNIQQMKVIMQFFDSMDVLLQTGFAPLAKGTTKNYHNLAISYNKPHALKGFYPDVEVDYPKIIISAGDLPQAANAAVEMTEEGLKFSWSPGETSWPDTDDQVMLLAYAPANRQMTFKNSGARRSEGHDILEINAKMRNTPLEIYISFVSDDRLRAADSLYIGRIGE